MIKIAPQKKLGRPTKLTADNRKKMLRAIARGMPLIHAAKLVGVTFQTFLNHRNSRPKFNDAVDRAIAKGIQTRLEIIGDALKSPDEGIRLRAACWYLEHTAPEHFSKTRVELTGKDGAPITGQLLVLQWPHNQNKEANNGNGITADNPASLTLDAS